MIIISCRILRLILCVKYLSEHLRLSKMQIFAYDIKYTTPIKPVRRSEVEEMCAPELLDEKVL